jgi:hypothetical protein
MGGQGNGWAREWEGKGNCAIRPPVASAFGYGAPSVEPVRLFVSGGFAPTIPGPPRSERATRPAARVRRLNRENVLSRTHFEGTKPPFSRSEARIPVVDCQVP